MAQQQLVLEPLGIVTEPNKLGQIPAGALSVMSDCVERSPGVIENIQAWQAKVTVTGTDAGTTAMFGVPMDGNLVVVIYNVTAGWKYRWYNVSTGAAVYAAQDLAFTSAGVVYQQSINVAEQPGFSFVRHGTQTFVNTFSNVLVWDDPTGATLASSLVRVAGLQRVQMSGTALSATVFGSPMPANSYATYVAINTRQINGRKVGSPPSAALVGFTGGSTGAAIQLIFKLRAGDQIAGDILEVYRTKSKPNGLGSGALSYQAGEEAGAEYQRVLSHTLTAAEITAITLNLFDTTPDVSLGEALYTNQAIFGSGAAAEIPPAVELLTSYKGYLFGFAATYPPSITLRPTGTWGGFDTSDSVATINTGFGYVYASVATLTGASFTLGSNTINVSPTSQLNLIGVGMSAIGTGFNGQITVIGASSFTINTLTTGASAGTTWTALDGFDWNSGFGSVFNASWQSFAGAVLTGTIANSDVVALRAQSLKLASTTPSSAVVGAVGFTAQPTDGFDFYHRWLQDSRPQLGVRSSKGKFWDPQIATSPSDPYTLVSEDKQPRAFVWSEQDEPESWPFVNEDSFSRGTVNGVASTSDAIIAFYTDGIWRLSGTGGTAGKGYDWRADPIAAGITVVGSQAVAVLLDKPYAMTSEGLIVIGGNQSQVYQSGQLHNITQGRVHDQLSTPPWNNGPFTLSTAAFVVEDEEHDEILLREPSATAGKMWIYNTHTDRLSQTTSHAEPMTAFYSRALRSPVVVGRDGGSTWTLKAQTGAYGNFNMTYANVYADNPFAQRHWQTLNVSAETAGATITPTFNGVSGSSRTLDADGRAGFEVPRNAPAIGNTMQVGLSVVTSVRTKLNGFALDYRDQTDRRKTR